MAQVRFTVARLLGLKSSADELSLNGLDEPEESSRYAKREVGARGESAAQRFLAAEGFEVLVTNWRCKAGEIDIVALEGLALVIVEVKTRVFKATTRRYLFDAVTQRKQHKLRILTEWFIATELRRKQPVQVRIDVVGVLLNPIDLSVHSIEHLRGVGYSDRN